MDGLIKMEFGSDSVEARTSMYWASYPHGYESCCCGSCAAPSSFLSLPPSLLVLRSSAVQFRCDINFST